VRSLFRKQRKSTDLSAMPVFAVAEASLTLRTEIVVDTDVPVYAVDSPYHSASRNWWTAQFVYRA
jgi:hypothetical protein